MTADDYEEIREECEDAGKARPRLGVVTNADIDALRKSERESDTYTVRFKSCPCVRWNPVSLVRYVKENCPDCNGGGYTWEREI